MQFLSSEIQSLFILEIFYKSKVETHCNVSLHLHRFLIFKNMKKLFVKIRGRDAINRVSTGNRFE